MMSQAGWYEGERGRHYTGASMPIPPSAYEKAKLPEGVVAFPVEQQRDLVDEAAILAVRAQVRTDMDEMRSGAWRGDYIRYYKWLQAMHKGVETVANVDLYPDIWRKEWAARELADHAAIS